MNLLKKLLISTIIVLLLSYFLKPGVQVDGIATALIVAVVLGLLNTFVKPILVFFTLPITFFTLGLFLLVINTVMVYVCDYLVDGFDVNSFVTAMLFSVLLSISQWILYKFIKD
ncbi:phage holin family protein [Flavobacterium amniphilum]|uniref:phage holin family protein n=1 Tax=Flavobacterium amniphilum TaxID=1834035 RepID=UPI00202A0A58|nr:phage holin family protein [Flavobacterium amniphilum]MCL9804816.1 phage holin family protein [Flavobacterium amniphilum]